MKKTTLLLAAMLFCSLAFAKPKYTMAWDDINTLQGMTQEKLLARLGKPERMGRINDYWDVTLIKYSNLQLLTFDVDGLVYYQAYILRNANFCVYSTMVKGGLRVGDNISKAAEFPSIRKCEAPLSAGADYLDETRLLDCQYCYYNEQTGSTLLFNTDKSGKILAIIYFDKM